MAAPARGRVCPPAGSQYSRGCFMSDRIAHYNILSTVGTGPLGPVYRARDTILGRTVAIRVVTQGMDDPAQRARALDLVQPYTALTQQHVATLFEVIAGHDPSDATSFRGPVPAVRPTLEAGPEGLRVGVIGELAGVVPIPAPAKTNFAVILIAVLLTARRVQTAAIAAAIWRLIPTAVI